MLHASKNIVEIQYRRRAHVVKFIVLMPLTPQHTSASLPMAKSILYAFSRPGESAFIFDDYYIELWLLFIDGFELFTGLLRNTTPALSDLMMMAGRYTMR